MINYERFCGDIDLVFNLPVILCSKVGWGEGPSGQDAEF